MILNQWCQQDLYDKTKTKTFYRRPRPIQNPSQDQEQDLTEYDSELR